MSAHVHVDSPADLLAAQRMVTTGERTCFLHAACRGGLETHVRLASRAGEAAA